ncbi:glycosyltransferase family 9 protein [Candidatus Pelagibacter sp. HIMB1695]|uniref:glycosyltransferase family 9 protein n=1 Tax=Candidatus Pelagibacter sp. HIMB1695 TaxID=3413364 RepID=UPI003F845C02
MKILVYNSGGGLGDSIQIFDLINSLITKFGSDNIYYLSAHKNHFNHALLDYNLRPKELKTNIIYFGFRWWHLLVSKKKILKENSLQKFDIIIDIQSKLRNTVILKQFPSNKFYSSTFNFKFCSEKKDYKSTKFENINILRNIELLISDEIPQTKFKLNSIDLKYFQEAKRLLPDNNYIGFSMTQGNVYRKKSWPIDKFLNIAEQVSKKNKKPVFFVEKSNKELIHKIKSNINNALFPEIESTFSGPPLVSALSSRLEKAISIDNGVMHMMSLAEIPMIVLFGPTNSKKFSPKLKNIEILDSKNLYQSDDITKITEDDVMRVLNI